MGMLSLACMYSFQVRSKTKSNQQFYLTWAWTLRVQLRLRTLLFVQRAQFRYADVNQARSIQALLLKFIQFLMVHLIKICFE